MEAMIQTELRPQLKKVATIKQDTVDEANSGDEVQSSNPQLCDLALQEVSTPEPSALELLEPDIVLDAADFNFFSGETFSKKKKKKHANAAHWY